MSLLLNLLLALFPQRSFSNEESLGWYSKLAKFYHWDDLYNIYWTFKRGKKEKEWNLLTVWNDASDCHHTTDLNQSKCLSKNAVPVPISVSQVYQEFIQFLVFTLFLALDAGDKLLWTPSVISPEKCKLFVVSFLFISYYHSSQSLGFIRQVQKRQASNHKVLLIVSMMKYCPV